MTTGVKCLECGVKLPIEKSKSRYCKGCSSYRIKESKAKHYFKGKFKAKEAARMVKAEAKPILFNTEMVKAIDSGRKTQTRRPLTKVIGLGGHISSFHPSDTKGYDWIMRDARMRWNDFTNDELLDRCPFGRPGDHLWIRETFSFQDFPATETSFRKRKLFYRARGDELYPKMKWKPSIHLPRIYGRIVLEITDVKIEQVQDISHKDALAEGVAYDVSVEGGAPLPRFEKLWNKVYKNWDTNPWVWVVHFKVVD